jgi:phosphate-selective porin OprO/OprP
MSRRQFGRLWLSLAILVLCNWLALLAAWSAEGADLVASKTNAVPNPHLEKPSAAPTEETSREWLPRLTWEGWDGLHYDLSRRRIIPYFLDPKSPPSADTNLAQRILFEEISHKGKFGMKLQLDGAAFLADKSLPPFQNGVEVRHARVYVEGEWSLLKPIAYQFELGYVPDQFYMEDSYVALQDLRVIGKLKLGNYKTPMGLDQKTSSRDRMFMEAAAPIQALTPGANAGLEAGRSLFDQRMTWAAGAFGNGLGSDFGDASKNAARVIARVTGLPWFEQNPERPWSQRFLHLGLSVDDVYSVSGAIRYRTRPESHLAPYVLDTHEIEANNAYTVDFEAAWVQGPFSLQGEYLRSVVFAKQGPDLQFQGFYVSASWFLTGESRAYDRNEGIFSRFKPREDFNWKNRTWGALEFVGRYSYTDLSDANVQGGRLSAFTAGVTWYPHPHIHWKFNYVHGNVTDTAQPGHVHIFETRAEIDF